jgi:hypothetical protein
MNKLTDKQREFLQTIAKLHNDDYCLFRCNHPSIVGDAIIDGGYSNLQRTYLNNVRADYIKWLNG